MKRIAHGAGRTALLLLLLAAVPLVAQYSTLVYMEQGGSKQVVMSGGEIEVRSGGTVDLQAGASVTRPGQTFQVATRSKVGATAGWAVAAATNVPDLATLPASQTGSTLVIPLHGLRIGDTITGFRIIAQVESAGGAVTIDAILRATTNVAAEPTDAAIGTGITQVSVTADTAVSAVKTGLTEVVTSGKSYYLLITATTAAATDIILQHPEITITQG